MAGYLLIAWGNARVDPSILGIYSVLQPAVTVLCAELVILLTAAPHYHLVGIQSSDLGAIGIVAGLLLVVYDNWSTKQNLLTGSGEKAAEGLLSPSRESLAESEDGGQEAGCQGVNTGGGGLRQATGGVAAQRQRLSEDDRVSLNV